MLAVPVIVQVMRGPTRPVRLKPDTTSEDSGLRRENGVHQAATSRPSWSLNTRSQAPARRMLWVAMTDVSPEA
jgi:hypothetical protein